MLLNQLFEMTIPDLRDAKYGIEWLFKDLNVKVVWSAHFVDRTTHRESTITKQELVGAFTKLKSTYLERLVQAKNNHETFVGVLKDVSSDLNIPLAFHFDVANGPATLNTITIMRKNPANFHVNKAGGDSLYVESVDDIVNSDEPDAEFDLPIPTKIKKTAKHQPTTDAAENSLIKTLWHYNAADAS